MSSVYLKESRVDKIRSGYLWVFRRDIKRKPSSEGVVDVLSGRGKFIGKGYYNPSSKIAVRILTYKDEPLDRGFFLERLKSAKELRERLYPGLSMYRAVFSEGDGLPGLIVDRYGGVLSVQVVTKGMESLWGEVEPALEEVFEPEEIVKRRDSPSRAQEGLEVAPFDDEMLVESEEFGIKYLVDVKRGHKTGFYMDQKDNRLVLRSIARGKRVLDLFSYTGAWSLNALAGGAKEVWTVDISSRVLELFKENLRINGFSGENVEVVKGDAFDLVKEIFKSGERFDVVVNDPPAFAKKDADLDSAKRGYKYMNLYSIKLLKRGGLLFTFSCSQHFTEELLLESVLDAAKDAGKRIKILRRFTQSMDHPVNPAMPETFYLKGFLLEVTW